MCFIQKGLLLTFFEFDLSFSMKYSFVLFEGHKICFALITYNLLAPSALVTYLPTSNDITFVFALVHDALCLGKLSNLYFGI